MVYTEIKNKNGRTYYYRVKSMRNGKKFKKQRIYLGKNLSQHVLSLKIKVADKELNIEKRESVVLKRIVPKIKRILKKNKVKRAGIFGSYARGEQKKNSDIDILVEPPKGMGFGFAGMGIELEEKLGKKVHLVTYKYISPYIKKDILKEEIKII